MSLIFLLEISLFYWMQTLSTSVQRSMIISDLHHCHNNLLMYMTVEIDVSGVWTEETDCKFSDKKNLMLKMHCLISMLPVFPLAEITVLLELLFCGEIKILNNSCICLWDFCALLACFCCWYFFCFVFFWIISKIPEYLVCKNAQHCSNFFSILEGMEGS